MENWFTFLSVHGGGQQAPCKVGAGVEQEFSGELVFYFTDACRRN